MLKAKELRDAGVAKVSETLEFTIIVNCVTRAARGNHELTADHAWKHMERAGLTKLKHPNAVGAAFRHAIREKLIAPTGRIRQSGRTACRGRNLQVWRSLVYRGGK